MATTEVEVRFTPEGDGTRVELEHRRLGAARSDGAAEARGSYGSENGWEMVARPVLRAAWRTADSDADVDRLGGRAVADAAIADELGEAAGSERLRAPRSSSCRRPPAQLEHVLGVELLPGEARLRLERRRADEVVLLALAVPLAADERDDVEPRPDAAARSRPS